MSSNLCLTPTPLTSNFSDFKNQLQKFESLVEYVHIDIMDGQFVDTTSFTERTELRKLKTKLNFELHLMVDHPLEEMKQWIAIPNVFRALFHLEALDSPEDCIDFAKEHSWQKGLVLNPDTPLYRAESYFSLLDVIQFMTVQPGRQGQDFIPEVGEKIRAFTKLEKRPLCAADGAVNKNTIKLLKSWGVEIFNVGSALTKAVDVTAAYKELRSSLN